MPLIAIDHISEQVLLITQRAEEIVDEVATVSFFGSGGGLNTVRRPKGMAAASLLDLALGLNDGAMLRLPPPPTLEEVAAVWRAPQASGSGRSRSSSGGSGVEGSGVEGGGVEGGGGEGSVGEGGALLVEALGLRVQRGEHVLLEGLDWVVRPGEHWLIAGGNGAGKSTLSRLLVRPDLATQGAAGVLRVLGVGSTGSRGSKGSAGSAGSAAAASATELPEGWAAHTSDKNGRVYYRHEKDKVTTWTRPVASASVPTSTSDGLAANKPKAFLHPAYSRGDASERRMLLRQRSAGDDLARSGDDLARSKIVSAPPGVGAPPPPPPSESHSHTPLAVESEGEAQQEGARAPAPRRRGVGWLSTEVHLSLASSETLASSLVESPAADGEDKESHAALISAVYRWLGLDDGLLQRPFRALSQGEQKMVLLAAALVARPRILVLDEPAQGLDLLNRKRLLATVQQVCAATGTGLVYITHHYEEVLPCVTHVLLLKKGGHVAFCGERKAYEEARLS